MPHINYAVDFTVEVFVVYENKVLLRKHDKYGIWLSVGGHIEPNEDPIEAAIREVKEEVGLDITLIPTTEILNIELDQYKHILPPAFINRHRINKTHEHVTLTYFAKSNSDKVKQGDSEISEDWKWFTLEELEQLSEGITETVKEYARTALKTRK
ncbi:NUDIX domain-containing protein [Candidatus Woesearchaeota archaeon]|mgnify:FL=1|jgi:8-oxo-dGTP pyrophosphatase MutT (NUDIX family)|nr:NUDIX domain-containing protein [Candidatus Woesearchaeota archaeon]